MLQIGGKNAFRQGIAQTVHETYQGVDARTGQSRLSNTTGMVMGNKALRIARSIAGGSQNALKWGENLLPVFDALGNVVAYERSMDPAKLNGLQRDTHLGRMLGAWTGRIAEESMAEEFNRDLLKVIKKTYDDQAKDPKNKFVNVADKKNADSLVRDALGAVFEKQPASLRSTYLRMMSPSISAHVQ